ncbi:DNA gyrase C-terminal beta-propeller domain-containing protein, partial [Clostridium sp.]
NEYIYFFTKRGMVKKTALKEFEGNYLLQPSYKFKYDNDELISIEKYNENDVEMIIITKKGMGIKFLSNNINPMGKIASGVTGISLKEGDEVIYGRLIGNTNDNSIPELAITSNDTIILISKNKDKKEISVDEIKLQNRAGKGSSIMTIVLDDEIKDIV